MKQMIGYTILFLVLVVLFSITWMTSNLRVALICWGIGTGLVLLILLACWLICGE